MITADDFKANRRAVLRSGGAVLLAFSLNGCDMLMTPDEARDRGADYRHLDAAQVKTLEAFAEALVPGARKAGIAHFVDANLTRPPSESLLTIRYLDFPPPYFDFYSSALTALDAYSKATVGSAFADLDAGAMREVIKPMLGGQMEGWDGPPPPLLYLAVRSDAADLVYGTVEAFERMGLPYVAHIEPTSAW